jgi:hypothetical protein
MSQIINPHAATPAPTLDEPPPPTKPFKLPNIKTVLATLARLAALPRNRFARATPAERRRWSRMGVAARKQKKRERQRAARRRAEQRHSERWREFWRVRHEKLACETIRGRMILAMEAGEWYARSDLVKLIGGNRNHRGAVTRWLLAHGLVHRVPNPEYRLVEQYAPEKLAAPWYLYQLTIVSAANVSAASSSRPSTWRCISAMCTCPISWSSRTSVFAATNSTRSIFTQPIAKPAFPVLGHVMAQLPREEAARPVKQ